MERRAKKCCLDLKSQAREEVKGLAAAANEPHRLRSRPPPAHRGLIRGRGATQK